MGARMAGLVHRAGVVVYAGGLADVAGAYVYGGPEPMAAPAGCGPLAVCRWCGLADGYHRALCTVWHMARRLWRYRALCWLSGECSADAAGELAGLAAAVAVHVWGDRSSCRGCWCGLGGVHLPGCDRAGLAESLDGFVRAVSAATRVDGWVLIWPMAEGER